ncbi:hypothetical protein, partial [uncultured Desulfovibrio sp.]
MAWFKKRAARQAATATETEPVAGQTPPVRRRRLRRLVAALSLVLLTVTAGLFLACFWAFQTEAGHAWLLKTANAALAGRDGGLSFRLTRLEGSVPFDCVFGLEAADG